MGHVMDRESSLHIVSFYFVSLFLLSLSLSRSLTRNNPCGGEEAILGFTPPHNTSQASFASSASISDIRVCSGTYTYPDTGAEGQTTSPQPKRRRLDRKNGNGLAEDTSSPIKTQIFESRSRSDRDSQGIPSPERVP